MATTPRRLTDYANCAGCAGKITSGGIARVLAESPGEVAALLEYPDVVFRGFVALVIALAIRRLVEKRWIGDEQLLEAASRLHKLRDG